MPESFSVAVNVSPQILGHPEFTTRVKALKAALDQRNRKLIIELTEDSLVQGDASSLASIERLRKLGVDLAIDDFGKGYSSLTYLKQIPAAEIKIDKRFIGTVAVDETDKQIVKTVIALAHALGMRVVAEGVDSAEAVAAITELECEMAQGFFIGRPMRGDLVPEWMAHYAATATMRRVAVVREWPEQTAATSRSAPSFPPSAATGVNSGASTGVPVEVADAISARLRLPRRLHRPVAVARVPPVRGGAARLRAALRRGPRATACRPASGCTGRRPARSPCCGRSSRRSSATIRARRS